MAPKVWLVIGCSSGFGEEIALQALNRGDKVIATSRTPEKLAELAKLGAETIKLDVCDSDADVQSSITTAVAKFGRLDILVNNAGYILVGTVDQCTDEEYKKQYDTNVFGMIKVLRATLPIMRKQRAGVVANLGSIGGWRGTPVGGVYCSTKFAVVGLTEAARHENSEFGIEVLTIEPGYFRTNFLSEGHKIHSQGDAGELSPLFSKSTDLFAGINHKQPGDPKKGSTVIVEALTHTGPWEGATLPLRLVLGRDAQDFVGDVISRSQKDLSQWEHATSKTDCDDVVV